MKHNQNIFKIITFVLLGYIGVWLWPVFSHQRFFYPQGCEFNCVIPGYGDPRPMPYPAYTPPSEPPIMIDLVTSSPSSGEGEVGGEDVLIVCTADAKLCDDGSSVGRIAPNCEFDLCPNEKASQQ